MTSALIQFTQSSTTDAPGFAVIGTLTDGSVQVSSGTSVDVTDLAWTQTAGPPLVDSNPITINSWSWTIIDVPPTSTIPLGTFSVLSTGSFAQPDATGGYLVGLTVTDGVRTFSTASTFQVPEPSGRYIVPFRAVSTALKFGGSNRGWAPSMEEYLRYVDTLTSGQNIFDSTTALGNFDDSILPDGTSAQVAGIGYYYLNRNSFGTDNGIDFVGTLSVSGLWERHYTTPANAQTYTTVYVNSATGRDFYPDPTDVETPLATLNEAFRRISYQRLGNNITIQYTGTALDLNCDMTGVLPSGGSPCTITVVGASVTVGTAQPVASVVAPSPSTNTRSTVVLTGATTSSTMFKNNNGSVGDAVAWVYNNDDVHTYTMTEFIDRTPAIHATVGGNSISPLVLNSKIQNMTVRLPYGYTLVILQCGITGQITTQLDNAMQLQFKQCHIENQQVNGPRAAYFENCSANGFSMQAGSNILFYAGLLGGSPCVVPPGATLTFGGSVCNEGSRILVQGGAINTAIFLARADLSFSFFSSVADCLEVSQGGNVALPFTTVWGGNNSVSNILNIVDSGYIHYTSSALPTISGSWALGSRTSSSFAEWPVVSPKMAAGYLLLDPGSGLPNAKKYLLAQAANVGATNLFNTNPRKGLYRFSAYCSVNVAGTSGVVTINAIFTDDSGNVRTVAVATSASIVSTNGQGGSIEIETNGTTQVQYSITGIVTAGALSYSARISCDLISDG
jgi:hypothetical protein